MHEFLTNVQNQNQLNIHFKFVHSWLLNFFKMFLRNIPFLLLVILLACSPKANKNFMENNEHDFKNLNTSPGSRNVKIRHQDSNWNFRITIPKSGLTEKRPLVIALHWGGGGNPYEAFSTCLPERALENQDVFIIAPDGEGQRWTADKQVEKVKTLLQLAKNHWPIDTTKIIVSGFSNGGNGSWHFADRYPNLFSAAIPIASGYPVDSKIEIPTYVIHGAKDELFPVEKMKAQVDLLKKAGTKIELNINPNYTHYMACDYVEELKTGIEWVMKELK